MKNYYFIVFIIISLPNYLSAQAIVDTSEIWDNNEIEKLIESATEENENSTAVEELIELEENPIDLNSVTVEELIRVPSITSFIATNIVNRRFNQPFVSVDELLNVEGVTPEVLSFIRRFVTIKKESQGLQFAGSFLSRATKEIEKKKGYKTGIYPGSSVKILNRGRLSIENGKSNTQNLFSEIRIGIITEKDAGERSLTNLTKGYISISSPSILSHIIIGDYQVEASEGILFWTTTGYSKGSNVITPVRKNGIGIRPNLSSDENFYFRGLAFSLGSNKVGCQVMYSNKPINASIDTMNRISSIDQSGLFRTENEQKRRNSSRETMIGYNAYMYLFEGMKIGATGYKSKFLHPLIVKNKPDKSFYEIGMQGISFSYLAKKYELFSEAAHDYSNVTAVIGGIRYQPVNILALTFSIRNYPSDFHSIYGKAFAEKNIVQNEKGIYFGIRLRPTQKLCISSYYDQFEYLNPNQQGISPSHGSDFLALTEYRFSKQFEFSFRFKQKKFPFSYEDYDIYKRKIDTDIEHEQKNYRLTCVFMAPYSIRLVNKIEWTNVSYEGINNKENGLLLSQSIKWNLDQSMILRCRLSIFETASYDSRIYDFEDDLPGAFSNVALYGKGLRWYLMINCQIMTQINISAKYSQTLKDGAKSLGTGYDEIIADSQGYVSAQIDVRF